LPQQSTIPQPPRLAHPPKLAGQIYKTKSEQNAKAVCTEIVSHTHRHQKNIIITQHYADVAVSVEHLSPLRPEKPQENVEGKILTLGDAKYT
jgi:hypothetical protein